MIRSVLLFGSLGLVGCGDSEPSCGEDSPYVAQARALSQYDLSHARGAPLAIHTFMLARDEPGRGKVGEFADVPKALVTLDPYVIDRAEGNIYLETCSFDYKVLLQVNNPYDTERFVQLHWGGWRPDEGGWEVLWQEASQE